MGEVGSESIDPFHDVPPIDEDGGPPSSVGSGSASAEKCPSDSLRSALELLPIGIIITRASDGLIRFANRRLAEMVRVSEDELIGQLTESFYVNVDDRRRMFEVLRTEGVVRGFEVSLRRGDGTIASSSISIEKLRCGNEECTLASVVDVTTLKDTEESLKSEQRLLMRLLELHERDRQLIGFEIHDGLIQDIAGAQMLLQSLAARFEDKGLEVPDTVRECERVLLGSINHAREIINGLQPPVLSEAGLSAALQVLVDDLNEKYEKKIVLQMHDLTERFLPAVEMAVYRVVQESLTNAVRHSEATEITVLVAVANQRIVSLVSDNGIGFDPKSVKKKHYGIVGLRERAKLMGGRATIDSSPGAGTRVTVEIPVMDTLLDVGKRSSAMVLNDETE